jgi:hypothetical protein
VQRTKLASVNEQDPLVLYTNASTKAIAGVLMQIQGGKTVHIRFTYLIGASLKMGNTGAGIVRFRVLRQAMIPVLNGQTIYRSHRP